MIVSARHIVLAATLASGFALAGDAQAGDGGKKKPTCCGPTIQAPDVVVGGPNLHVSQPDVWSGDVNVHVNKTHVTKDVRRSFRFDSDRRSIFVLGGGTSSYCCEGGPAASSVSDFAVTGVAARERVVMSPIAIQAFCLDDRGTPHPASQRFGERAVPEGYDGEIFRCIAGTSMQATVGGWDGGAADFDNGTIVRCAKGEALRHGPDGAISCATQEPQRNCFERSLLRKYGPGIKTTRAPRTVLEPVETVSAGPITFDGGVGAGACGVC